MPDVSDGFGAVGVAVVAIFVLVGLLVLGGIVTGIVVSVRRSASGQPAGASVGQPGQVARNRAASDSMLATQQMMQQQLQLQQQMQNDQLQQQLQQQIIQNNINNQP